MSWTPSKGAFKVLRTVLSCTFPYELNNFNQLSKSQESLKWSTTEYCVCFLFQWESMEQLPSLFHFHSVPSQHVLTFSKNQHYLSYQRPHRFLYWKSDHCPDNVSHLLVSSERSGTRRLPQARLQEIFETRNTIYSLQMLCPTDPPLKKNQQQKSKQRSRKGTYPGWT